jgi:hypothetical protein
VADRTEDTWHHQDATRVRWIWPFSGYGWTSTEVTRVTTHRVTRGMLTSAADVAADVAGDWAVHRTRGSTAADRVAGGSPMWHTRGPIQVDTWHDFIG